MIQLSQRHRLEDQIDSGTKEDDRQLRQFAAINAKIELKFNGANCGHLHHYEDADGKIQSKETYHQGGKFNIDFGNDWTACNVSCSTTLTLDSNDIDSLIAALLVVKGTILPAKIYS